MNIDLSAAADFMATHARLLDRRRFQAALGEQTDPAGLLAALDGYRNPDGGYGWGLEPDLRSPESQTGAALHAFEVFTELAPATAPQAVALCDWLDSVTLADGGMPFAMPLTQPAGSAPWWEGAPTDESSLQITAIVTANAHRAARHDPAVARHPWLIKATRYCLDTIDALTEAPQAMALSFAISFLDQVYENEPRAAELLAKLGKYIPDDGLIPVPGGTENEAMRPLDYAPFPGRPARSLVAERVVDADLDRLAAEQRDDGGWTVEYAPISPQGALEWRGYATVRAVSVLRANGRM